MAKRNPKSRSGKKPLPPEAENGVRLHKVMAEAGVASRRDSEELILQGRVKVNGEVVKKLPAWVDPVDDRITVDGEPIRRTHKTKRSAAKTYIMVNKPKHVICTNDDPEGRKRLIDKDRPIRTPRRSGASAGSPSVCCGGTCRCIRNPGVEGCGGPLC